MSEDIYKKIFSINLRKYMEINNKSQNDLINDLGLSSSTVSNWCTGLKLPRMNKIQMLADYFKIEKSDLLEEEKPSTVKNDYAQQLIDMGVTDEDFEKIKKYYYAIIKDEK